MLFAQIISFILVMVIFEAYQPGRPDLSAAESILAALAVVVWLWAGARTLVWWQVRRLLGPRPPRDAAKSARRLTFNLQVVGIAVFCFLISIAEVKAHLLSIHIVAASETLRGLSAAGLYFILLAVIWHTTLPLEKAVFGQELKAGAYVRSQARFVAPVLFPWFIVALMRDATALLWPRAFAWLDTTLGDLVFLGMFVVVLSLVFPPLVRTWWGCKPLPPGRDRHIAQTVLEHVKVRVGGILDWPILEGKALTAGILGIAPRLRYLLITPALAEALTDEELAGVVAHEAGHVRHRHMILYVMFFLGFFVLAYALTEPFALLFNWLVYLAAGTDWGVDLLSGQTGTSGLVGVMLSLPLMMLLVVYLRFFMGYFMRHFERQADFFALATMGEAEPLVGALEKIARMSGNIRDLPSWHHFSVAQRVEALRRAEAQPALVADEGRHIRRGVAGFWIALVLVAVLGLGLASADLGQDMRRASLVRILEHNLELNPRSAALRRNLGILLFEQGREEKAVRQLALAYAMDPQDPEGVNALAWVLATAKDPRIKNPGQAVALARQAVSRAPNRAHIWDTLAEAYFQNGQPAKAVAAARAALAAGGDERREYYEEQLERFTKALETARSTGV